MKRLLAVLTVMTVGTALTALPVRAQEEQPPLGAVTDGLREVLEGARRTLSTVLTAPAARRRQRCATSAIGCLA